MAKLLLSKKNSNFRESCVATEGNAEALALASAIVGSRMRHRHTNCVPWCGNGSASRDGGRLGRIAAKHADGIGSSKLGSAAGGCGGAHELITRLDETRRPHNIGNPGSIRLGKSIPLLFVNWNVCHGNSPNKERLQSSERSILLRASVCARGYRLWRTTLAKLVIPASPSRLMGALTSSAGDLDC